MTLQELLAKADLPGDLEFKDSNGNVFKLADLRTFGGSVESERTALKAKQDEAVRAATEASQILTALQKAMEEQNKGNPPAKEEGNKRDWRKNPLYEELVPVVETLEGMVKTAVETQKAIKQSLDLSQAVYALDRMRSQWNTASVKPKDKKFEDVVKEVLASQDKDEYGLPTLAKYLERVTEPDRMQAAIDAALKKNNAEWEQKSRMAANAKPGSGTRFSTKKAGEAPIKKLDELTSELVANDPDVAKAMEGEIVQ